MAFTTTSKFVQITPYLLMEYMYADEPTPETYFVNNGPTTVGYDKLINGYMSNTAQVFNRDGDYSTTHNTTENSVVRIGESSFVTLDSNLIIPFNDYSDELTNSVDLPITFPSNIQVVYDSIKYHIRAGYNLNNIDGLIMGIEFQDQNLEFVTVSQIIIKKGTEQDYYLNPSPVTIGSNIYDKYFEIKIPNLNDMGNKYLAASSAFKPQTLASLISSSGNGFVYGSPIRISAWQVQNIVDYNGYERYNSSLISVLSLEQEDPFSNIGATIKESDQGQFFEYYATDNEGFIEDFILFQNSIGNSYYISHEIEVLEQIGAAFIQTSQFQSIQTTAYDLPNYYRPIVRNAGVAASFSLRYTMSLINSVDQNRTIRISTYTSSTPSQWGTNITPISLSNFPQVQKIYNRIYSQADIKLGNNNQNKIREIVKYNNVFIDQNYVTATVGNLNFVDNTLSNIDGAGNSTAYGTGKLTISISPFDNYYKFKFIKSGPSGDPVAIDLSSSGKFNLSFVNLKGNKIQIPSLDDKGIANPLLGELAFRIDESISMQILQITDRRFFITNGTTISPSTGSISGSETIKVASGVSSGVLEKKIESVIAARRDNKQSIASVSNSVSLVGSTLASTVGNSSSVMYWGYWKKDGETDFATGATAAPAPVIVTSGSGTGVIGTLAPASSIIKTLKPVTFTSGRAGGLITANVNTSQTLTGNVLISALSAEMAGYKAIGWADQTVIQYFLTPGKPGYIKYPKLSRATFSKAAEGILSPASIAGVNSNGRFLGRKI
jgi:hypothetical protein